MNKNDFKEKVQKYTFFTIFPRNGLYDSAVLWMYFVCTLGVLRAQGYAYGATAFTLFIFPLIVEAVYKRVNIRKI